MLQWLVGSCRVFGLDVQNWMLVIAGALVIYCAVLCVVQRHRHPH